MLSCDGFSDISCVCTIFYILAVLHKFYPWLLHVLSSMTIGYSSSFPEILQHWLTHRLFFILMDPEIPSSKMFDSARRNIMAPIQAMRIMVGIQWENCWLIRKAEISHRLADTKCPLSTQATLKSSQWNTKSATDDEFFTNNPIFGGKSQRFSASDQ